MVRYADTAGDNSDYPVPQMPYAETQILSNDFLPAYHQGVRVVGREPIAVMDAGTTVHVFRRGSPEAVSKAARLMARRLPRHDPASAGHRPHPAHLPHAGRNYRLTDVHGRVVNEVLA